MMALERDIIVFKNRDDFVNDYVFGYYIKWYINF